MIYMVLTAGAFLGDGNTACDAALPLLARYLENVTSDRL